MILKSILKEIQKNKRGEFVYPLYESYCFSNIPKAILSLFGAQKKDNQLFKIIEKTGLRKPQKVVLFLIDSLGFNQWLRFSKKYEIFQRFNQNGIVAPITTIFPSTTAGALNTINSCGLTPKEHGLLEWWMYFKEIGKIIAPLPFIAIGETGFDKLLAQDVDPKIIFNQETIYEILKKAKVGSFTFTQAEYVKRVFSNLTTKGSKNIPFTDLKDLLGKLCAQLKRASSPSYFSIYYDKLDTFAHAFGPFSQEHLIEVENLSLLMIKEFLDKVDKKAAKETLVLLTADHGQVNVNPKETIYLSDYKKVVDNLEVLPWGSTRDVFLKIKRGKLEETLKFLKKLLKGKAMVMKTKEVAENNLFGQGRPHPKFKERLGDLLILPYQNNTVWYEYFKGKKFKLLGTHGGLSEDEMVIPFVAAKLSDLL